MARTKSERIMSIEEQIAQLENQKKRLARAQREDERKARTHRICERGGHLESILPDTVNLTFEQFKVFMEKTLLTDFARRTLKSIAAEQAAAPSNGKKDKDKNQDSKVGKAESAPVEAQEGSTVGNKPDSAETRKAG